MWYFSWMLGLGLAAAFSILNALWLEISRGDLDAGPEPDARAAGRQPVEAPQRSEA